MFFFVDFPLIDSYSFVYYLFVNCLLLIEYKITRADTLSCSLLYFWYVEQCSVHVAVIDELGSTE